MGEGVDSWNKKKKPGTFWHFTLKKDERREDREIEQDRERKRERKIRERKKETDR